MKESKWIIPMKKQLNPSLRLFCFPHSGGSARVFKPWAELMPDTIEVYGIQYPGRGTRFPEEPITEMAAMVAGVNAAIQPFLDRPFALFGHSLGGGIALDLAKALQLAGKPAAHMFVSGRRAPHLPRNRKYLANLPEAEFRKEVFEMGGMAKEILDHPELMDMVSPIMRADLSISEKYQFSAEITLNCPLTVFGGDEDGLVEVASLPPWSQHTSAAFEHHVLPGGHFFVDSAREALLRQVAASLKLG